MKAVMYGEDFKNLIKYLNNVGFNEGRFNFTKDGLKFEDITQDQICLVKATIPKDTFIEFEGEGSIDIDLDILNKVLNRFANDRIAIKKENNKLIVSQENRTAKLNLYDLGDQQLPKVSIEPEATISGVDSVDLIKAIKTCDNLSSRFKLTQTKEGGFMVSTNSPKGDYQEVLHYVGLCDKEVKVCLNCDYALSLLKGFEGEMTIQMSNEKPVCFKGSIGKAQLECWIAPVMDEDEIEVVEAEQENQEQAESQENQESEQKQEQTEENQEPEKEEKEEKTE